MKRPRICFTMKCVLVMNLVICVKTAPYMPLSEQLNQMQMEQSMLNQIAQESMDRFLQNQYNVQQQLMAMQGMQALQKNNIHGPMPLLFNLHQQPILMLLPNTMTKINDKHKNHENDAPNLKHGFADEDTIVVDAENEANMPEMGIIPRNAVVLLPNGQRFIIGSIISAIPFLPFEVNVPDSIGWIYNGIAGIIGGIGQRLPFRPKPTTEAPVQPTEESMTSSQESMNQGGTMEPQEMTGQESRWKWIQKLMTRKQTVGMPILMLPLAQPAPVQVLGQL